MNIVTQYHRLVSSKRNVFAKAGIVDPAFLGHRNGNGQNRYTESTAYHVYVLLQFAGRNDEWLTVYDILDALSEASIPATVHRIRNTLSTMSKRGHLSREYDLDEKLMIYQIDWVKFCRDIKSRLKMYLKDEKTNLREQEAKIKALKNNLETVHRRLQAAA